MSPKIAIIGGTGICDPSLLTSAREEIIRTPYGTAHFFTGNWDKKEVIFLPRHGSAKAEQEKQHNIPPHKINYRANIWALKTLEIERVLATSATGSLDSAMKAGSFAVLTQFIDFTKSRPWTFFEEGEVTHVDMTEPYCPELRRALLQAAQDENLPCSPSATYLCTEGPRFETPAEINAYRMLGADLVGMTNVPEVVLAREAELCYASIAVVTNMAAGIAKGKLTATEVEEMMATTAPKLTSILKKTLDTIPPARNCACRDALKGSQM